LRTTDFDRVTAVREAGGDGWAVSVDPGWGAPVGPNGGYVAALILRAMMAELGRPERAPRSLTVHYLRPPGAGAAHVQVTEERSGRSLSSMSARLIQDGETCALALAAFSTARPAAAEYSDPPPQAPAGRDVAPLERRIGGPSLFDHVEIRPAIGGVLFRGGDEALTGGWLRLVDRRPVDILSLALFCDTWWPSPWMRLTSLTPAPTIDLTIHFRSTTTLPEDEMVLVRVRSSTARDGFFEEDSEVWSSDGTLLAQSRQLALLIPPRPR